MKIIQMTKLTPAECVRHIQQFVDHMKSKSPDLKVDWEGNRRVKAIGTYNSILIDAVIDIEPGKITLEAKDPGIMWRKAAEIYLTSSLKKYLDSTS